MAITRLGAQQPTLSRHVAELEARLKVALFERTGRGVVPTSAALAIAEAAWHMEEGVAALHAALAGQATAATGSVRITTSQVAASYLLPSVLTALRREEPGIQIELIASNQLSNLLRREADIALRMVRPAQASLVAKKLADLPIVACAHEAYLERAGSPRQARDLLRHQLIGYDRDDTIVRGFAQLGVTMKREQFALRTDNQVAYGRLVAAGAAGIGFAARYNIRHWPGVVSILPGLPIPPLPCWLAVHREIRGSPIVRRVFDFLAEAVPRELAATLML